MRTLTKWTVAEYHNMIEKGVLAHKRVELLAGELVEMVPESPLHRYTMQQSNNYLRRLLAGVAIVQEGHPITLKNSEPELDIAVIKLPESQYKVKHPHVEDIYFVAEISRSTLAYDLGKKQEIYAAEGVPEYWVIDLNNSSVHVFSHLIDQQYSQIQVYQGGSIKPQLLPDIEIEVAKLFD